MSQMNDNGILYRRKGYMRGRIKNQNKDNNQNRFNAKIREYSCILWKLWEKFAILQVFSSSQSLPSFPQTKSYCTERQFVYFYQLIMFDNKTISREYSSKIVYETRNISLPSALEGGVIGRLGRDPEDDIVLQVFLIQHSARISKT